MARLDNHAHSNYSYSGAYIQTLVDAQYTGWISILNSDIVDTCRSILTEGYGMSARCPLLGTRNTHPINGDRFEYKPPGGHPGATWWGIPKHVYSLFHETA